MSDGDDYDDEHDDVRCDDRNGRDCGDDDTEVEKPHFLQTRRKLSLATKHDHEITIDSSSVMVSAWKVSARHDAGDDAQWCPCVVVA